MEGKKPYLFLFRPSFSSFKYCSIIESSDRRPLDTGAKAARLSVHSLDHLLTQVIVS